ncbi:NAD(P)-binding protein [Clathrospora elynae]|uniref:NAD(P)-binding protein n=1 Tax=Clathrospora elynae TaxID=706981 RepID=A0A6A5T3F1_9PLEO|nr:NAD(P)-binding protein [Clathrospora elynae]
MSIWPLFAKECKDDVSETNYYGLIPAKRADHPGDTTTVWIHTEPNIILRLPDKEVEEGVPRVCLMAAFVPDPRDPERQGVHFDMHFEENNEMLQRLAKTYRVIGYAIDDGMRVICASGMGLAVATSLSQRPDWTLHILDLDSSTGQPIASSLGATFHACDVTDESTLASIFKTVFNQHRRLDFVFANAGIAEHAIFYDDQQGEDGKDGPELPVEGMHALIDINLKSVITTTYLAAHWMRKSPTSADPDKSIVITASCGGLYPSYYTPIYTASKHGVVGFMRGIAPYYYHKSGIRVNAICPGAVRTNLLSSQEWSLFDDEYFTPVSKIAAVVCMLVDGRDDGTGSVGREVEGGVESIRAGVMQGRAVEISGSRHYYREAVEYADGGIASVMGSTKHAVTE